MRSNDFFILYLHARRLHDQAVGDSLASGFLRRAFASAKPARLWFSSLAARPDARAHKPLLNH